MAYRPLQTVIYNSVGNLSSNTGWQFSATPNTGATSNGYYQLGIPFNYIASNGTYTTIYISTSSVISFGSPAYSNAGGGLSATVPANDKIFVASGNGSCQNLNWQLAGSAPNRTFNVQFWGSGTANANTSEPIVWEARWSEASQTWMQLIASNVGGFSLSGNLVQSGIYNPISDQYPFYTFSQPASWSWTWAGAGVTVAPYIPAVGDDGITQPGDVAVANILSITYPNSSSMAQPGFFWGTPANIIPQAITNVNTVSWNITSRGVGVESPTNAFVQPNYFTYNPLPLQPKTLEPGTGINLKYPKAQ